MVSYPGPLVDADWLLEHISDPQVLVLDASWYLPKFERSGYLEWLIERISGAEFFDYNTKIKDPDTPLPRMLPSADLFTQSVRDLGVNKDSLIVIYDTNQLFSAPRAWWMFRAMGHHKVCVLEGGLEAWKAVGGATEGGEPAPKTYGDFVAQWQPGFFIDSQMVVEQLDNKASIILDARSKERFDAGHIPGADSLPYTELFKEGSMKSTVELASIFSDKIDPEQSLICSCGSGVTACIIALAAELSGHGKISVYDGSWTEWSQGDFPQESQAE